jgi:hypothetical protein
MGRQASVIPCQDIRIEIDGKLTLVGVFTQAIGITTVPQVIPQIGFFVLVEGDIAEPLKSLVIEIHFPGLSEPFRNELPKQALENPKFREGQTRWRAQLPMMVAPAILNPGRIVCKVIHEQGEIETGAAWVATQNLEGVIATSPWVQGGNAVPLTASTAPLPLPTQSPSGVSRKA